MTNNPILTGLRAGLARVRPAGRRLLHPRPTGTTLLLTYLAGMALIALLAPLGLDVGQPGTAAPPAAVTAEPPAAVTAEPPANPADRIAQRHRVVPGDTLAEIALRYGVAYQHVAGANGLGDPDRIHAGQVLDIPDPPESTVLIRPGDTLGGHAQAAGLSLAEILELNPWVTDPDRIPAGGALRTS